MEDGFPDLSWHTEPTPGGGRPTIVASCPEDIVEEAFLSGVAATARAVGISASTVTRMIRRQGLDPSKAPNHCGRPMMEVDVDLFTREVRAGFTERQLATRYGVTQRTINRLKIRHGLIGLSPNDHTCGGRSQRRG